MNLNDSYFQSRYNNMFQNARQQRQLRSPFRGSATMEPRRLNALSEDGVQELRAMQRDWDDKLRGLEDLLKRLKRSIDGMRENLNEAFGNMDREVDRVKEELGGLREGVRNGRSRRARDL